MGLNSYDYDDGRKVWGKYEQHNYFFVFWIFLCLHAKKADVLPVMYVMLHFTCVKVYLLKSKVVLYEVSLGFTPNSDGAILWHNTAVSAGCAAFVI